MPFPKFSSGGSGRLTFDVMNELFSRVEKLEAEALPGGMKLAKPRYAFFARVTAQNTGPNAHQYSFAEVCRQNPQTAYGSTLDPAAWTTVNGGQTSLGVNTGAGGTTSSFRYPLIGTGISVGSVLPIVGTCTDKGDLIYVPVQSAGSISFPARIVSSTTITTNLRWQYQVKRVTVSGTAFSDAQSTTSAALNGAESVADAPPVFGVGMQPPTSGTLQMIRQPIRNNVIVTVCDDGGGNLVFSMPNGYRVIC